MKSAPQRKQYDPKGKRIVVRGKFTYYYDLKGRLVMVCGEDGKITELHQYCYDY